MKKILMGAIPTFLLTAPEGQSILRKTSKVLFVAGDKILKNKYGINVKEILEEEKNEEVLRTNNRNVESIDDAR